MTDFLPGTGPTEPNRLWRSFRWAFGRFAWVFPLLQLLIFLPLQWNRTDTDRDVVAYHAVAERIQQGRPVYDPLPPPGPHRVDAWYYLYPPFLAAGLSLLPALELVDFARVWLLVLLIAWWAYAAALCRLAIDRVTLHGTLVAGAVIGLTPGAISAMNMGQVDVILWPMFGAALAWGSLRGAGFAAAALTKVYGVWPLALAALREPRRTIPSALVATAIGVIIGAVALGPGGLIDASVQWLRDVAPVLGQGQFEFGRPESAIRLPFGLGDIAIPSLTAGNFSVSFAPLTIAHALGWTPPPGPLPTLLRVYLAAASLLIPLAVAWLARRAEPRMQYALVTCAALVAGSIFRPYLLPLFWAPIALRWGPAAIRR